VKGQADPVAWVLSSAANPVLRVTERSSLQARAGFDRAKTIDGGTSSRSPTRTESHPMSSWRPHWTCGHRSREREAGQASCALSSGVTTAPDGLYTTAMTSWSIPFMGSGQHSSPPSEVHVDTSATTPMLVRDHTQGAVSKAARAAKLHVGSPTNCRPHRTFRSATTSRNERPKQQWPGHR